MLARGQGDKGSAYEDRRTGGHEGWSEQLVDRLISWPVGQSGQLAGTWGLAAEG